MTRLLLVLALALLSGCYRLSAPPAMSEAVKLEISGNKTHLVRFQPYLQDEVAKALERQLGWRVSPTGTATLGRSIRLEDLDNTAKDDRGVAIRRLVSIRRLIAIRRLVAVRAHVRRMPPHLRRVPPWARSVAGARW